jgi:16S rRNA (guanine527-N7)-methyltransferase
MLMNPDTFAAFTAAFALDADTARRFEIMDRLLLQWQNAVNLIAPATISGRWTRHYADSAQLLRHAATAKTWVDLGSGGGFPGLVVAILLANQEDSTVNLIESNGRKCAFLSEVVRQTGVSAKIHHGRIADIARQGAIPVADVISARALAPLDALLDLAQPFFGDASAGLFLKGQDAASEIADAKARWSFDVQLSPSISDPGGQVLKIGKLKPAGTRG